MIKPFIAKKLLKDGRVVKEYKAEVVNEQMCKESTLVQIQDMLLGVVENGTAKVVKSDYFSIAGKTGTAQIASGGGYSDYYVSFCGYFPADDPLYTCFVGIRKPKGVPSGGGQAGMVFKNIAEQTFVKRTRLSPEQALVDDPEPQKRPPLKNGNWEYGRSVLSMLDFKTSIMKSASDWVKIEFDSVAYRPHALAIADNSVPDVLGMGARDAVYLLEKSGLRVNLTGSGKVVSQSFAPGSRVVKGTTISITLR
jgi:cell division protein FtsI (penicillin-binding protein 3)